MSQGDTLDPVKPFDGLVLGVKKKARASGPVGNCVEATLREDGIYVTDSKEGPDQRAKHYTLDEWRTFVAAVKDGEFDL